MNALPASRGKSIRSRDEFLQQHFGKSAAWYLGIANGKDDRPVVADRPRKSSGSETTFERDLTESAEIEARVQAMADDVWAWCEKAQAFGRTVTVKVEFADFRQVTRSRSFSASVAGHDLLRQASVELVRTLLPMAKGVRLLGVTVSNFENLLAGELPLFADEAARRPVSLKRQMGADGAPSPLKFAANLAPGPDRARTPEVQKKDRAMPLLVPKGAPRAEIGSIRKWPIFVPPRRPACVGFLAGASQRQFPGARPRSVRWGLGSRRTLPLALLIVCPVPPT
jgi:hypothetical protein